ncbi:hypothetical protein HAX54_049757 [Datura stramonium]|uniref:Receptor ligand binding region domain-containing protein n=1 Tax=Datura stramonium TaxID=4076 RepID=A0ABS8SX85_DATST|nr:hypothetical protein [Datura stramonium]
MKMMEKGYTWITTNDIASLIHSMNASSIRSMQGVLGIQSYFPETGQKFQDFHLRFRIKFGSEHPHEAIRDPSIFAIQAYDATWALALALASMEDQPNMNLLDHILSTQYDGLSGNIEFIGRKLAPVWRFRIINVIRKSYRDLGFWSDGFGFSEIIDESSGTKLIYNTSMECLGHVIWPGGPWSATPRGWKIPTVYDPLIIGVPNNTFMTNHFVNVEYDYSTGNYSFSGFSIEVFETTTKYLPYDLPYKFIPFQGNYNALVEQVCRRI